MIGFLSTVGCISFLIHYLNDFFLANATASFCCKDVETFLALCKFLGVLPTMDKGPTQHFTYLGIEIDFTAMTIHLPPDMLAKLQVLIAQWAGWRKATKQEFLLLIGFLAFESKVVKPGGMFLRMFNNLSSSVSSLSIFVTLCHAEAQADITW